MKKTTAILLSLLLLCISMQSAAAETYTRITSNCGATVVHVIDGDSMRVRLTSTGEIALVRLIGVDATGRDDAFTYLSSRLTGKYVTLEIDINMNFTDRWNFAYVTYQNESVNADMLAKGFAQLSTAHRNAMRYYSLSGYQDDAQANEVGRWATDESDSRYNYAGNGVNINTATASKLQNVFTGVSSSVAQNIVSYRRDNPFNDIREIKFVSGFTKAMFDSNRRYMTVSTNIRTATRDELSTLANITSAMVERIIDYRLDYGIGRISTLINQDLVSESVYSAIEPYIDVVNRSSITISEPDKVVNINTASRTQLMDIGFTTRQADALIEYREKYSYKTLEELEFVPGVAFSTSKIDSLSDNMNTMTALNSATLGEIKSLLGSYSTNNAANEIYKNRPYRTVSEISGYVSDSVYNSLKPFVYINSSEVKRINLNTAQTDALTDIGFTASQATAIIRDRPYEHPGDIGVNTSAYDANVSLYTNINEAGRNELKSLSARMTDELTDAIIDYRRDQPFGSYSELLDFFEKHNRSVLYYDLREYLVFR